MLTAAHCFRDADSGFEVQASDVFLVIGLSDILSFGGYQVVFISERHDVQRNVSQIIIHPDYTNISISDRKDIALLRMNLLVPTPRIRLASPDIGLNISNLVTKQRLW